MKLINRRSIQSLAAACLLTLLSACGSSTIILEGDYPTPLVTKLPITLGVYYDEALQDFSYTEINESTGKDQYIIGSGDSQQTLFQTLLPSVFQEVVVLDDLENVQEEYPQIDAVFVPVIDDFQLGLPQKTRLNSYEIWIKYNMRLSESNGDYIADWIMTAYGKSPKQGSTESGINNAANIALRDLAASFALGFTDVPDIRDWLNTHGYLD